jgi:hypothetical protein
MNDEGGAMSNESPNVDDRRGFIFTIDRQREPVYQVDSKHWAQKAHRWSPEEMPAEIRDKAAELQESAKPGAFARFHQGAVGVYILCEKNIKPIPELAGDDFTFESPGRPGSEKKLSPHDIVICAKGGPIQGENGEVFETEEGDYYVIQPSTWGRFTTDSATRPRDVETTKEILILLEELHGKNFLSMSPDKPFEWKAPPIMPDAIDAIYHINCYVLNLSRFKR